MCTLVVFANVFEGYPLVVVANRDEMLERASSPPGLWSSGFLAPRDDVAGGTWLGINPAGVFVGITNRYLGPKDERESRGAIVARALEARSARAIHEMMATVSPARHNGFHLVYADGSDVLATVSDGAHLAQLTLGRGIHIVTERSFGAGDDGARVARIRSGLEAIAPAPSVASRRRELVLDRVARLLTEHDAADPLSSTCIHLSGVPYGTRSGMVLALADDPAASRMLWSEGPPCTTPFVPVDVAGILTQAGVSGLGETR